MAGDVMGIQLVFAFVLVLLILLVTAALLFLRMHKQKQTEKHITPKADLNFSITKDLYNGIDENDATDGSTTDDTVLPSIDVCEVMNDIRDELTTYSQQNKKTLDINIPSSPIWIFAERGRFYTALKNLITNEIQLANHRVGVTVKTDGVLVKIVVSDDGKKISQSELTQIFERFRSSSNSAEQGQTTLPEDSGVMIAKELTMRFSGKIEVRSKSPGAEFCLEFPRNMSRG